MRKIGLVIIISLLLFSCKGSNYKKIEDGIIVSVKTAVDGGAKKVRLQVVNDDIIHITATPTGEFSNRKSLISVLEEKAKTDWTVEEKADLIQLKTSKLIAHVSLVTGEVVFTDLEGNTILAEKQGGGKFFQSIEVDGKKAFSMHQVFESPEDEAFYGLGQHQSDEFNYKGKNETLYQYNTKVSVPFLISTKGYGILWDNYSLTRFGDPREYDQISQFKLYDKNGKEGGLTATYMVNSDPKDVFIERTESIIDYENLETVNNFPKDFPFHNSRIIWEGEIEPQESGVYHFILYYAGYTTR